MATFDRFDICEAYLALEIEWHSGGWLQERKSNQRRHEAISIQLARIGFKASPSFNGYESLSDNGKEIYDRKAEEYGFIKEALESES